MTMKKALPFILCIIICICMLAGCGDTTAAPQTSEAKPSEASPVDGEKIETEKFTMTGAKGWNKMGIPGGIQLYRGSDVLEFSVNGYNMTEADDKAQMESLVKRYDGTPVEETELIGMKFIMTSFTANGVEQSCYTAIVNGEQVKLQIGGKDRMNNKDIQAMVNSILLKMNDES